MIFCIFLKQIKKKLKNKFVKLTREQRKSGLSQRENNTSEKSCSRTRWLLFFLSFFLAKLTAKPLFQNNSYFFPPSYRPLDSSWLKLWCHRNLEQYSRLYYVASTILNSKKQKNNVKGKKVKEKQIYNIYGTSISASSTPPPPCSYSSSTLSLSLSFFFSFCSSFYTFL